ncbi:hypothetical protein ROHU_011326 [Labeo rohita]|uniref:Uncharacterized protein n=1 Tax=Labeo rohita TaxID=84645 RepID=A0A498LUB0_LABRO|nr:hypothetical protein ROHU_011326 [Labeo rohita]
MPDLRVDILHLLLVLIKREMHDDNFCRICLPTKKFLYRKETGIQKEMKLHTSGCRNQHMWSINRRMRPSLRSGYTDDLLLDLGMTYYR